MTTFDIIKKTHQYMKQNFHSISSRDEALKYVLALPAHEQDVAYEVYECHFYGDEKYPETAAVIDQIRASEA